MEKIIQISAGRGPEECNYVAAQVMKYLLQEARSLHIDCNVLFKIDGTENATIQSAVIQLEGDQLDDFLDQWVGTIQWIGVSPYRKFHKRKNWFVGVKELKMSKSVNNIKDLDIKYTSTRSGGPGGQHVNKVSTAVRATYLPTGLNVLASDSRSQAQNKKNARLRLLNLLKLSDVAQLKSEIQESWQNHNELERGNPVRVFKGSDFKPKPIKKSTSDQRAKEKREFKRNWRQELD